jgi:hypothetical protein
VHHIQMKSPRSKGLGLFAFIKTQLRLYKPANTLVLAQIT